MRFRKNILKALILVTSLPIAVAGLDRMEAVGDIQANAREVLRFDLTSEDACHLTCLVVLVVEEEVL